eukprot:221400-Pyramimonas_sp.AAC.1
MVQAMRCNLSGAGYLVQPRRCNVSCKRRGVQRNSEQCQAIQSNAQQCKAMRSGDEAATAATWRPERPAGPAP